MTSNQQALQGYILSLHASIESVYGSSRLHFKPRKLLNFDLNPDPHPAFHSNADPDSASQNNADPCGSGSATLLTTYKIYIMQKICGSRALKMLNFNLAEALLEKRTESQTSSWVSEDAHFTGSNLNGTVKSRFKICISVSFVAIFFTKNVKLPVNAESKH